MLCILYLQQKWRASHHLRYTIKISVQASRRKTKKLSPQKKLQKTTTRKIENVVWNHVLYAENTFRDNRRQLMKIQKKTNGNSADEI